MKLSELIKQHEQGPWSKLVHSERHTARARRMLDVLGDPETPLAPKLIKRVVDHLAASNLKPSSINKYLSVLDSMGQQVRYQREVQKEARVLSPDELHSLDANVRSMDRPDYAAFYAVLRDTGMRGISEYQRIDWDAIDFEGRTLLLESYKGRRQTRRVPMTDTASRALSWLYHERPHLTAPTWRGIWLKVRLDAQNRPYDLRHTYCTRLLDAGIPPPTVMQIMGHTSLDMTMRYLHQRPAALDEARQALERI